MAEIELNEDPASTWGASETYKAAWNEKYGDNPPAGNASKDEWVAYAVKHGSAQVDAEAATVAQLKEAYGNAGVGGVVSVDALQSTATGTGGGTTYGSGEAGAGAASGTAEGTASTSSSPATGVKGR